MILLKRIPLFIWQKMFSFLKQDLKILRFFDLELKRKMLALFLSFKDNTEYLKPQKYSVS